jgi:hypothetical protein
VRAYFEDSNPQDRSNRSAERLLNLLAIIAGLGLAFQVGHFIEHGVQFAVWVTGGLTWVATTFCGRDVAFMSAPVAAAVSAFGAYMFPNAPLARQMMLGMEFLHLVGNGIFLATIAIVYQLFGSKWVRYAFIIEGAHLFEHIALTLTAYYVGYPIGLSTLFGKSAQLWGKEGAVGWRVSWHFFMNLLPMPFVMIGMLQVTRSDISNTS